MPTIEKLLSLKNGPPWGFRLQENANEGLLVYRIRKKSPADEAGLQEGDKVLALNNVSTSHMKHTEAVQLISEFTQSQLDIKVSRQETKANFHFEPTAAPVPYETDFSSTKLDSKTVNKENNKPVWTAPVLQPFAVNVPTPKPFIPQQKPPEPQVAAVPSPAPLSVKTVNYQPAPTKSPMPPHPTSGFDDGFEDDDEEYDPEPIRQQVTPVDISKLMREYSIPEIDPYLKKKQYADSTFYSGDNQYFPTVEDQIQMARSVAASLTEPRNRNSAGARMFEKRRRRMEKWTVTNEEDDFPSQGSATLSDSNSESQSSSVPPADVYPGPYGYPVSRSGIPMAPPPPPHNVAKTLPEYFEKAKSSPKTKHDQVNPGVCFDIASALHSSSSRGAQIFAKKKARSKKWELDDPTPTPPPQVVHQLVPQMAPVIGPSKQKLPTKLGVSTATLPMQATQTARPAMGWQEPHNSASAAPSSKMPSSSMTSEQREWRPVQFKIPQKT